MSHYVYSPGDEDTCEVWCTQCGNLIAPVSDCIILELDNQDHKFYCLSCFPLQKFVEWSKKKAEEEKDADLC